MESIIYLDGKFLKEKDAKISVFDHGLLYGDGIFEGIRAYNGRVFYLEEHIDRLYDNAKSIMLNIDLTKKELMEVVISTFRKNNLKEGYSRLVITRGIGDLGLDPNNCKNSTIFCIAMKIALYPKIFYEKGLIVNTVPTRRNSNESTNPRFKSLNYLNNIMAKIESKLTGTIEAFILNEQGYVAEATGDNVFIVCKNKLITPPIYAGILEGVTRNIIIELAKKDKIEINETLFTRHDLYKANECFLTGTAAEVIPVIKVDGRIIGDGNPGNITKKLIKKFKILTKTKGNIIFNKNK